MRSTRVARQRRWSSPRIAAKRIDHPILRRSDHMDDPTATLGIVLQRSIGTELRWLRDELFRAIGDAEIPELDDPVC